MKHIHSPITHVRSEMHCTYYKKRGEPTIKCYSYNLTVNHLKGKIIRIMFKYIMKY